MKSLDQIRAELAYKKIEEHQAITGFLSLAQNVPTMLQKNGLLASWAFLQSKSREHAEHRCLINIFMEHLRKSILLLNIPTNGDGLAVFKHWIETEGNGEPNISTSDLRRITDEAIAFSSWLKRAAEAYGGGQ
jgi:CRISPR/Cas system CMR-associated protein Cmr5 small subunit